MATFRRKLCLVISAVVVGLIYIRSNKSPATTCGKFPEKKNIFVDNIIWQVLQTSFGFVYILNAYIDTRFNKTLVKLNVNAPLLDIKTHKFFCQFWFDDDTSQLLVVEATDYQVIYTEG